MRAPAYVKVIHDSYGCESGCCGHYYVVCDKHDGEIDRGHFEFSHPNGEPCESFIRSIAGEVAQSLSVPISYVESEVSDD